MRHLLGVEVVTGGCRRCRVGAVDDDTRGSKQEVIQQLLDERWTWGRVAQHTMTTLSIITLSQHGCGGATRSLTEMFFLVAAEREQSLDESEMSCEQDVICLTGLHLRAPAGLKVVEPRDLILQHGGSAHF